MMHESTLMTGKGNLLNVADEFARLARPQPGAPAVIRARHAKLSSHPKYESLSFARCLELADSYAQGLRDFGIGRYDTALIPMKPMLDLAPVFVALWKTGAVPLVLDGGGPRDQEPRLMEEAGPKALIGIPISHALRIYYRKAFQSVSPSVATGHSWFGGPTLESFLRSRRMNCLHRCPAGRMAPWRSSSPAEAPGTQRVWPMYSGETRTRFSLSNGAGSSANSSARWLGGYRRGRPSGHARESGFDQSTNR